MNKKIEPCENQEFLPQEVAESEKAKLDTAQKNLLQVELGEISDRFDEFQSVVNLYHTLGRGY